MLEMEMDPCLISVYAGLVQYIDLVSMILMQDCSIKIGTGPDKMQRLKLHRSTSSRVLHARVLHARILHARLLHARVLHARVLHARVLHARVLHARVLQARVLHARVLHARVLCMQVLHARVLHARVYCACKYCIHGTHYSTVLKSWNKLVSCFTVSIESAGSMHPGHAAWIGWWVRKTCWGGEGGCSRAHPRRTLEFVKI